MIPASPRPSTPRVLASPRPRVPASSRPRVPASPRPSHPRVLASRTMRELHACGMISYSIPIPNPYPYL
jgi:hypothetical protein